MMKTKTYLIFSTIAKLFFPTIRNKQTLISKYFGLVCESLKKNGTLYTVKYFKQCRLHYTRFMCGEPLHTVSNGVEINSKGLPSKLEFLEGLLEETKN